MNTFSSLLLAGSLVAAAPDHLPAPHADDQCEVTLFDEGEFAGVTMEFDEPMDIPDLEDFDDKTASILVRGKNCFVTVFGQTEYQGKTATFGEGWHEAKDLWALGIRKGRISSVKIFTKDGATTPQVPVFTTKTAVKSSEASQAPLTVATESIDDTALACPGRQRKDCTGQCVWVKEPKKAGECQYSSDLDGVDPTTGETCADMPHKRACLANTGCEWDKKTHLCGDAFYKIINDGTCESHGLAPIGSLEECDDAIWDLKIRYFDGEQFRYYEVEQEGIPHRPNGCISVATRNSQRVRVRFNDAAGQGECTSYNLCFCKAL